MAFSIGGLTPSTSSSKIVQTPLNMKPGIIKFNSVTRNRFAYPGRINQNNLSKSQRPGTIMNMTAGGGNHDDDDYYGDKIASNDYLGKMDKERQFQKAPEQSNITKNTDPFSKMTKN